MASQTFISPGVYSSEKDITFITRQVGVTTLGLVGETTIGPAFQPIFISNYGEFKSFFGGLNNTLVKDTNAPQYELPYIAKSYLEKSNQLFVTRVLGFSGYDAGLAWAITLDGALDTSSVVTTNTGTTVSSLITFTATSAGTNVTLVSTVPLIQTLINDGSLTSSLAFLGASSTGTNATISSKYVKTGSNFNGVSFSLNVTAKGVDGSGNITGTTSGVTVTYSGTAYSDVENKVVALLRSRGSIDLTTQLPSFEIQNSSDLKIDTTYTNAVNDPLGMLSLSGKSITKGNFTYNVSFDKTKPNYIAKVLGRTNQNGNTSLFVEELYDNMFKIKNVASKIKGIKQTLINYGNNFSDYLQEYQSAVTPWVVSELRGNKVLKLFRFHTISDGNSANEQFKVSIVNIKLDTKEFDVQVRGFNDTDARPVILESYSRCSMDITSSNYIGRKIGTVDGVYQSKSSYFIVEVDDTTNNSDAFPCGFIGYPIRDYQSNSNTSVVNPDITFNKTYSTLGTVQRKTYLGLSDTTGIDADFFDYKGVPQTSSPNSWTGVTNGFHMDIEASAVTIDNAGIVINVSGDTYSPNYKFDTGNAEFKTESGVVGTPYEKTYARKFTLVPYGGFDGWDIYNTRRSNTDKYTVNGTYGSAGLNSGAFASRTLSNGDLGINSDYYAFLEAIWTFKNPESVNINVFATPGIDSFDNTNLVEATIDMIEQDRADSIYIVTTPDTDASGLVLSVDEVAANIDGQFDSNYSCTYWPWIQVNDTENNVLVYIPPTRDVVRNIALTDNISFPWFAVAGVNRGNVDAIQTRKTLTLAERDVLYENRINPIATFTSDGIKIWGNKTLQVNDTALNKINIRRLLLQARKLVTAVGIKLLFEQNDSVVRNQFLTLVNPILDNIRSNRGIEGFRVVLNNAPEDLGKGQLTGQIFLKPTKALEVINIGFTIMNSGASFDNI